MPAEVEAPAPTAVAVVVVALSVLESQEQLPVDDKFQLEAVLNLWDPEI